MRYELKIKKISKGRNSFQVILNQTIHGNTISRALLNNV